MLKIGEGRAFSPFSEDEDDIARTKAANDPPPILKLGKRKPGAKDPVKDDHRDQLWELEKRVWLKNGGKGKAPKPVRENTSSATIKERIDKILKENEEFEPKLTTPNDVDGFTPTKRRA